MSAVTIRPAVSSDAPGITRTFLQSAEHHAKLDPHRYFVPGADAIAARYRDGHQHPADAAGTGVTLVAEADGEIVGFVDARLERSADAMHRELLYCHVIEVAVEQDHQRRGIGRQLLHAAEDWGREHGADLVSLEFLEANSRAAALYRRLGYRAAAITGIKRL
ncbi:MAG TPA: GNAT family N-acetyltransferase [Vicinamibacterales bacterium]|nr:GNAT family N-acetyltransferase [Vicinamibacterales bacterium]